MSRHRSWSWAGVALVALAACGDEGGDGPFTSGGLATLELSANSSAVPPGGVVGVSPGGQNEGETASVASLRIINTGTKDLRISAITVESTPPGAFSLADATAGGGALGAGPFVIAPQNSPTGELSLRAELRFNRPTAGVVPSGQIIIKSNSVSPPNLEQPEIRYSIVVADGSPRIQLMPSRVDFEVVPAGTTEQKTLSVLNQGSEPLVISGFLLSGHPNYGMNIGAETWEVSPESAGEGITLETPLSVPPGSSFPIGLRFTAESSEPAEGRLVLFSNDPSAPAGSQVELRANVGGPCIAVNPRKVDFGGKLVGRTARVTVDVSSCGDRALEISELKLVAEASGPEFNVDVGEMTGRGEGQGLGGFGAPAAPVIIAPNQTRRFVVEYFPEDISPLDEGQMPVRDTARIRIKSNAFAAEYDVDVSGFGVERECPTAVIVSREGEEVIPQTELNLIGSQSYATTGAIATWKWRVSQPPGSASVFKPTDTSPDVKFEVNTVGRYLFELVVTDAAGEPSCAPARLEVIVNPDRALHVELLWDTPNDANQADEGSANGTDLDLHVKHPFAVGGGFDGDGDQEPDGWFDDVFDCFWYNARPNWGNQLASVDDNPRLDRDDTDGAGPEIVTLNLPEEGVCYGVGVQYWKDGGNFGTAKAAVLMYIYGSPVFDVSGVELTQRDLWWVGDVCWPPDGQAPQPTKVCAGTNTACDADTDCTSGRTCGFKITPQYNHPAFPTP